MVHCSGGAQTKILHFIDELRIIKNNMFNLPPLFRIIKEQSETSWEEMYKVFNMGHRFEIYTDKITAENIIKISNKYNLEAQIIGHCEASDKKELVIESEFGTYIY